MNVELVVNSIIKKYSKSFKEAHREDLYQEARVAAWLAEKSYNKALGASLKTWVNNNIYFAVQEYIYTVVPNYKVYAKNSITGKFNVETRNYVYQVDMEERLFGSYPDTAEKEIYINQILNRLSDKELEHIRKVCLDSGYLNRSVLEHLTSIAKDTKLISTIEE